MITLHSLMSVLGFQATALVHIQNGEELDMLRMVRRIA